jgi:hypothetical protein
MTSGEVFGLLMTIIVVGGLCIMLALSSSIQRRNNERVSSTQHDHRLENAPGE